MPPETSADPRSHITTASCHSEDDETSEDVVAVPTRTPNLPPAHGQPCLLRSDIAP